MEQTTNPYLLACTKLGLTPRPELTTEQREDKHLVSEDAYHRLIICIEAKNLDGEDDGDYYYPIWRKPTASSPGFSYFDYDFWGTYTIVGARLEYFSYDLMREGVKEFDEYYQNFLSK